jgi:hypothetical protein
LNLGKLGLNDRILAVVGVLAFVDSFLPWYSVTVKSAAVDGFGGGSFGGSTNGWSSGFAAWFPLLLLLAIGIVVVLPAFEQKINLPGGFALIGILALVATILVLLRWLTYPSVPTDGLDVGVSAGASFGTYIGLVLGIVATVFAYLSFTASGGSLSNIGAAFSTGSAGTADPGVQVGYQAPGAPYQAPGAYQDPNATYQPPQAPYQPPQNPPSA